MIDAIFDGLKPVIVETLLTLLTVGFLWLNRKLPARMRLDIDARHRETLHSALNTGVGYALDTLEAAVRLNPAIATADATIEKIVDFVPKSARDAIAHFNPTQEHLENMARAKVQEWLASKGIDPLTAALRDAGAPVGGN